MPKKRKLNSKNPKYHTEAQKDGPVIDKRIKMCDVAIRNASGNKPAILRQNMRYTIRTNHVHVCIRSIDSFFFGL